MSDTNTPNSIEEALDLLDQALKTLESGEQDLEQSFNTYQEGLKLVQYANAQIDNIEKKCLVISENGELNEL